MLGVLESFQYVLALRHAKIHQSSSARSSTTGQLLGKESVNVANVLLFTLIIGFFFRESLHST